MAYCIQAVSCKPSRALYCNCTACLPTDDAAPVAGALLVETIEAPECHGPLLADPAAYKPDHYYNGPGVSLTQAISWTLAAGPDTLEHMVNQSIAQGVCIAETAHCMPAWHIGCAALTHAMARRCSRAHLSE